MADELYSGTVMTPSSSGLGHHPFTVVTRVRLPWESLPGPLCVLGHARGIRFSLRFFNSFEWSMRGYSAL